MKFHHLGIACRSVKEQIVIYQQIGYREESEMFRDETQGVAGLFMVGGGPRLELLENLPGSCQLDGFIKRGISFYHSAYICIDFLGSIRSLISNGALMISNPQPAVAFKGKRVCFIALRNGIIVELIEP